MCFKTIRQVGNIVDPEQWQQSKVFTVCSGLSVQIFRIKGEVNSHLLKYFQFFHKKKKRTFYKYKQMDEEILQQGVYSYSSK